MVIDPTEKAPPGDRADHAAADRERRPGPSILAQLVTAMNSDATPLERQSRILARGGAPIAPSTLGDWYAGAADLASRCGRRFVPTVDAPIVRCADAVVAVLPRSLALG